MNRILKNNTASAVVLSDVGITVPASGQYIISPNDYGLFEASSDVIAKLTDNAASPLSTLSANDGTIDLSPNDGVRLLLGEWSRQICDGEDTSIKASVIVSDDKKRLCVDTVTTVAGALVPALTSKLRYDDMNAATGGVARATVISSSWVQVYGYTGTGLLHGFILNLETKESWAARLVADGEEIFGPDGMLTNDMVNDAVYDIDNAGSEEYDNVGIHFGEHDKIMWGFSSLPLKFYSSVQIFVRRTGGDKKFRAGLVSITKE